MKNLTDHADQLFTDMNEKLAQTEKLQEPLLSRLHKAMNICSETVAQLNKMAAGCRFASRAEEIAFFKTIKPPIVAEWIYYSKVQEVHLSWPLGDESIHRNYLGNIIGQCHQFFDQNREFYRYCRKNGTELDELYFRRSTRNGCLLLPQACYIKGDESAVGYDMLVATIIAFDRLLAYLEKLASPKNNGATLSFPAAMVNSPFEWTNDKVDFVAFIYTLQESGAVNKGKVTRADLFRVLAPVFNIEIKDPDRKWIDIQARKGEGPWFIERFPEFYKRALEKKDGK